MKGLKEFLSDGLELFLGKGSFTWFQIIALYGGLFLLASIIAISIGG